MSDILTDFAKGARVVYMGKEHADFVRLRFERAGEGIPAESNLTRFADDIYLVWKGDGKWAVSTGYGGSGNMVFSWQDGEWEYEPMPSGRTDEFIARTRYPLSLAYAIAKEAVNGKDFKTLTVESAKELDSLTSTP